MTERANQTIADRIICKFYQHENKTAWPILAHQSIREYNNTLHSFTGYSPSFLSSGVSDFENHAENIINLEAVRKSAYGTL